MRTRRFVFLGLLVGACGATASQAGDHLLPLTRLRLYESGVGYFEREGGLDAHATALPVPESHVDDVLSSLVLLGEGGEPSALRFPSRLSAAVARARAGLPADTEQALGYDRVLASLRGEQVEVFAHDEVVRGRVIEAIAVGSSEATYLRPAGASKARSEPRQIQLVLLTDDQRLQRVDASALTSVRPIDPSVAHGYAAALSARRSLREGSRQALLELFSGVQGRVHFGYVTEVPLWRPTYRLLLDARGARLQAWAVVHNDTDEPWHQVRVTLETGYPRSFLFPLTAPRYGRRDLVHPLQDLPSVPQLLTTNADAMWGDFGDYEGEGLAGTTIDDEEGEGIGLGMLGTVGHGAAGGRGQTVMAPSINHGSRLIAVGDLRERALADKAVHAELAALPVVLDLPGHHSALVPFLMGAIEADVLTWFDAFGAAPSRALRIVNGAARTLPDGPLSVYRAGEFTGEGVLHRVRTGEAQYVHLGGAQGVAVRLVSEASETKPQHLAFHVGDAEDPATAAVIVHGLRTSARDLELAAQAGGTAHVAIALPIVANAVLEGVDGIDYDVVEQRVVGLFDLPAGGRKRYHLTATEGIEVTAWVGALTEEQVRGWLGVSEIPAAERAVAEQALPLLARVYELALEHAAAEAALKQTKSALNRLREPLSKTTGDAAAPVITRLLELEQQMATLGARQTDLATQLHQEQLNLAKHLAKLPTQPPG